MSQRLTTKDVMDKTRLSAKQLARLVKMGVIPRPTQGVAPQGQGRTSYWDESVVSRIHRLMEVRQERKCDWRAAGDHLDALISEQARGNATVGVILAAGRGTRLWPIGSGNPAAMVPVAGKPLISTVINHMADHGIRRVIVVVGHLGDRLREYLENAYEESELTVEVVEQPQPYDGPLSALREAIRSIADSPVLIQLGDTLVRDRLELNRDFVLFEHVPDYRRWCLVTKSRDGTVDKFFDKLSESPPVSKPYMALVGVYFLRDLQLLRSCIDSVYSDNEKRGNEQQGREYQLSSALERYARKVAIELRKAGHWYDVGNLDNYQRTRSSVIQSRSSNEISVDQRGVVTKKSDSDDLHQEINWYASVPSHVLPLTPRIFGFSREAGNTHIQLEYLPSPTLAEYYLSNVNNDFWDYAVTHVLDRWHETFFRHTDEAPHDSSERVANTQLMYWNKIVDRLEQLPTRGELHTILHAEAPIEFNGKTVRPWCDLKEELQTRLLELAQHAHWSLIHGDLHFGNIHFDVGSAQVKLIDPRGIFGNARGCYGDARYDLAKFLHSFHGGFALLSADMFRLKGGNGQYALEFLGGANRDHLLQLFDRWLSKTLRISLSELILVEATLFLSMLPLHADSPRRQVAACLVGLQLATEALNNLRRRHDSFRICADLDGTICNLSADANYSAVEPVPEAIASLTRLREQGAYIIIYTALRMRTHNGNVESAISEVGNLTRKWLIDHNVPYDELVFGKPYAHCYIDDLAVRFETWPRAMEEIARKIDGHS